MNTSNHMVQSNNSKISKHNINKSNKKSLIIVAIIVIGIFLVSFGLGRYPIPVKDVIHYLFAGIFNQSSLDWDSSAVKVFFYIRLPRVIVALTVGAALAVAGTVFQGMFRNPLVSPDILGVTSGCSFGAAMGILIGGSTALLVPSLSFIFGIFAMLAAYTIASATKGESTIMLVLSGMVVSAFFSAALSLVKFIADPYDKLPSIVYWLMGQFSRVTWDVAITLLIVVIPCFIAIYLLSWKLDVLSLGDDEAASLGLNVKLLRLSLITAATFLVAASVSAAGAIGWVGLVIPHIARMLSSSEHTISIPMATLVGGGFLLLMDDFARNITTGEIPIGILTAAIGAPFFAYLLIKRTNGVWNR